MEPYSIRNYVSIPPGGRPRRRRRPAAAARPWHPPHPTQASQAGAGTIFLGSSKLWSGGQPQYGCPADHPQGLVGWRNADGGSSSLAPVARVARARHGHGLWLQRRRRRPPRCCVGTSGRCVEGRPRALAHAAGAAAPRGGGLRARGAYARPRVDEAGRERGMGGGGPARVAPRPARPPGPRRSPVARGVPRHLPHTAAAGGRPPPTEPSQLQGVQKRKISNF
eukprot:gene19601-biopygen8491